MSENINFVLKQLHSEAYASLFATIPAEQIAILDASSTGVFYMKTSNLRNIFQFQTDAINTNDLSGQNIKYYVNMQHWPESFELNPANAMMDQDLVSGLLSVNPISTMESNGTQYSPTKMFVKDDFIRYLALELFGTYSGVDLFNNQQALEDNIQNQCDGLAPGHSWYDISNALYSVSSINGTHPELLTDISGYKYLTRESTASNNLSRELMNQIGSADPNRFSNISETAEKQPVPLYDGDSISFLLTIKPALNQEKIVNLTTPINPRTYRIKIFLISDTDTTHQNTSPFPENYTAGYYNSLNVSLGLIYNSGFTWQQLLAGGYTLQDAYNANIPTEVLRESGGFTASQLSPYYNAQQLQSGGYSINNLLDATFTLTQLIGVYTSTDFNNAGISISSLITEGYTLANLLSAGFTLSELKTIGYTKAQFIAAQISIPQLIAAGFTQTDLSTAGYVQSDLSSYFYYGTLSTPIIDSSMVVSYTFDSSSNGTLTNNAGGFTYNYGTLVGGASVSRNIPIVNGTAALSITNTNNTEVYSANQYAYLEDSITTSSAMTFSIWFQTTGVSGEFKTLFDIPYANDARGISLNISGTNTLIQQNLVPIPSISGEYLYMNPTVMYTFDRSFNKRVPNVVNWAYDASMVGNTVITTTTNNYVVGNGAMTVLNTDTAYGNVEANTASQYIITKPNSLTLSNNATFSIWFNGTSTAGKLLSLFDITNTTYGTKGISIDISGNQIMSAYVDLSASTSSYITNFTTETPIGAIANGTIFDGWTANSVANTSIVSNSTYGSGYSDAIQSGSASGRSILMSIDSGTGPCGISRSIYLYANYTYTLTFFIGTRQSVNGVYYYRDSNYLRGTITNSTNNSTPNPIFNISGTISSETQKTYTFTVPTSSNYTLSFISGSDISIPFNTGNTSTYILRNVSIF